MIRTFSCGALVCLLLPSLAFAAAETPQQWEPLVRVVDLSVGETSTLTLCDGTTATVKLVSLRISTCIVNAIVCIYHNTVGYTHLVEFYVIF